ncbi:hypothetical protein HK104_006191, partial [Borealophlyctis nickersoniae]
MSHADQAAAPRETPRPLAAEPRWTDQGGPARLREAEAAAGEDRRAAPYTFRSLAEHLQNAGVTNNNDGINGNIGVDSWEGKNFFYISDSSADEGAGSGQKRKRGSADEGQEEEDELIEDLMTQEVDTDYVSLVGDEYVKEVVRGTRDIGGRIRLGFQHERIFGKQLESHHYAQDGTPPWVERIYTGTLDERLGMEIEDFTCYIEPTEVEMAVRNDVFKRLAFQIAPARSGLEVLLFGSAASGLYLPDSDIDLVIYNPGGSLQPSKSECTKNLRKHWSKLETQVKHIELIGRARVPIIKLRDSMSGLRVDISYNQLGGSHTVDTIRGLAQELPALKPLCLVLKLFLINRELNEVMSGGVGGYAIILWIAAFLRLHPLIYTERYPEGTPKSTDNVNLGALLLDFFHMFGFTFDYHRMGLSPRGGDNPDAPEYLFLKELKGSDFNRPLQPYLLAIEDPQDSSNNVTKGTIRIRHITTSFAYAYDTLRGLENDRDVTSLLGKLMHVHPQMVEFRRAFRQGAGGTVDWPPMKPVIPH